MRVMNKKGAGHFEVIISFIFFIGFTFFIFFILNPFGESGLPQVLVEDLEASLVREASIDYAEFSLRVSDGLGCLQVDNNLFEGSLSNVAITKLSPEQKVNSKIVAFFPGQSGQATLFVDQVPGNYKVQFSDEFIATPEPSCGGVSVNYASGNVINKKVISNSTLYDLQDQYYSDYEGLKDSMLIPSVYDFAITSTELENFAMEREIPVGLDVIAQDVVLEVLTSEGDINLIRFTLRVW